LKNSGVEGGLAEEIGGDDVVHGTCSFFCYTFAQNEARFTQKSLAFTQKDALSTQECHGCAQNFVRFTQGLNLIRFFGLKIVLICFFHLDLQQK
jgi:hypothetical protein